MISPDFKPLHRPALFDGYFGKESGHPYCFRARPHNTAKFWASADWTVANKQLEIPFVRAPEQPYDTAPRDLTVAVSEIVKLNGARIDGAFLITEFGNVLVPSRDSSQVYHVGDWKGTVWLEDAYHPAAEPIELYGAEGLRTGDTWKRPYIGASYNTTVAGNKVLLTARNGKGTLGVPGYFEEGVLPLLKRVHWDLKMQFLVTFGGLLLTRASLSARGLPEPPVYCGTLDLERWKAVVATL
jgi:hypothetical protein